jgi:hypothetical protein
MIRARSTAISNRRLVTVGNEGKTGVLRILSLDGEGAWSLIQVKALNRTLLRRREYSWRQDIKRL